MICGIRTRAVVAIALALSAIGESRAEDAHRQHGAWRAARIGGGGYVQQVVFTADPNTLYTWVDVGGVYRSADGGATWRLLNGGLPATEGARQIRGLSADPRNADAILVAAGTHWGKSREGIYASRDGGRSFERVLDSALFAGNAEWRNAGAILARSRVDPDLVLAGSMGDGIFRSTDSGATWSNVGLEGVYFTDIVFDTAEPQRVIACAQPFTGWRLGERGVTLAGGVYRSEDAGATWEKLADSGPAEIVQSQQEPNRFIGIVGRKRIVTTTDAGLTWHDYHTGLPSSDAPGAGTPASYNAITATRDALLTAGGDGAIYRRTRDDAEWKRVPSTAHHKPDWSFLRTPEEGGWTHFGRAAGAIAVDPRAPGHWILTDWFGLWTTTDAGRSWSLAIDGIEATVIHALAQDPTNPQLAHLGMADNGYFRSIDGATGFSLVVAGGITNNIKSISVSAADSAVVYATGPAQAGPWHANAVFVSRDAGKTWNRAASRGLPPVETRRINTIVTAPHDADTALACVSGDVRRGAGGVYETRDGGASWNWIGEGLPERPLFRSDIWHVGRELAISRDGSIVCASHDTGGVFARAPGVAATQPAGFRQVLDEAVRATDIAADPHTPGRFLLADGTSLLQSTDSGATWAAMSAPAGATRVVFDMARAGRIAVATADSIAVSDDNGKTFTTVSNDLPIKTSLVPVFIGDRLVVGTHGAGAWVLELGRPR